MKLLSINVALPQVVATDGQRVETGIFKQPVNRPVRVGKLNIDGDGQADLAVHGGVDKAVYVYSWKNVEYWKNFLKREDLHPGSFGENLTVDELIDAEVCLGDQLEIGTARFQVTQPRLPCFKLGIAMGRPDFVKIFHESGRNGFYLRVIQEGVIEAGDTIRKIANDDPAAVTVAEFVNVYRTRSTTDRMLNRLANLSSLPNSWKLWLKEKVEVRPE
jgi:MOSC domain-containing protein YiiM